MKLIPVDQIPKMNGYHKLQDLIEEFVNGDAKIVRVDFGSEDYKSPSVCRSCLAAAIKRSKHQVKVWRRGNEVFEQGYLKGIEPCDSGSFLFHRGCFYERAVANLE